MYSSRYSHVSKCSPQTQKKMQYHSKGKSCGYYMRIVFFFSSLIQSLIIVSLVLFLIYGNKQDSASLSRIQDLEESFSRLSIENVLLRKQKKNLTNLLNSTLTEKARNVWELAELRHYSNISFVLIQDINMNLQQCIGDLTICKSRSILSGSCSQFQTDSCNCGVLFEQMKAKIGLLEANFTQTTERMRREMDQTAKDRDILNLQVIVLRRDKFTHEKEVEFCKQKCKNDFAQSLSGISNVTKAFLHKVNSLFPTHLAFQLTCPKQREHLEQIRSNCTSLSREVEDRFQNYLNNVGEQVSSIQAENSHLNAENWRLSEDYRWCSQNRSGQYQQHRKNLEELQQNHDKAMERVLLEKLNLNGEIKVLNNSINYKTKEVAHLAERLKYLNITCMSRTSFGGSRTGTGLSTGWSQIGNSGSSSSGYSRTGSGSSLSSNGSPFNKPGSNGLGSSSTSLLSTGTGSSSGLGNNKPASSGGGLSLLGSTGLNPSGSAGGTGSSKPALTSRGSSTSSSSGSTGTSSDKSTTNAKSSSGSESSSSSTGSKSSTGFSWFGLGSSKSKSGSGTGSSGAGKTNEGGGNPVSVSQHLQTLQRLINPGEPAEKQDLSRMLG